MPYKITYQIKLIKSIHPSRNILKEVYFSRRTDADKFWDIITQMPSIVYRYRSTINPDTQSYMEAISDLIEYDEELKLQYLTVINRKNKSYNTRGKDGKFR